MQEGVEEEEIVIISLVLLSKAMFMKVLQEIINGLDGSKISVRFALLVAPKTCFPALQFYLEQTCGGTQDSRFTLDR